MKVKKKAIEQETERLAKTFKQVNGKGVSIAQLLCRPNSSYQTLLQEYPETLVDYGAEINLQIELALKYAGYIDRQTQEVAKLEHLESIKLPTKLD